jgi:hypothetical protein
MRTQEETVTAAVETVEAPPVEMPEGAHPITLPVMVVEGLETSDGRFINPGALSTRALPLGLYAQTRSTHGAEGDAATWLVGAITEATRHDGPEVTQLSTGKPFPEGTYVWSAKGWMYDDVPAAPQKSAYQLVKDGALRGNSVDLSAMEAEFEYAEDAQPGDHPDRIVVHAAVVAATTLVGQPAFQDAYVALDGMPVAEATEALTAGALVPAWRSADIGDTCSPCVTGQTAILAAIDAERLNALADGDLFDADETPGAQDYSTSGMVALVPANPNILTVPGGDPAGELHMTLAYLGDEVDQWDADMLAAVHRIAREFTDAEAQYARLAAEAAEDGSAIPQSDSYRAPFQKGPVTATVFSHAVFNPNGDNGRDPATVYLFDGQGDRMDIEYQQGNLASELRNALGQVNFPEQHSPFIPHVTAGYGVPTEQLTYTGPIEFDRLRVAIGDNVTDYPLGGGQPALVASAATLPPAEWFTDPKLTEPTPLTVTDDGRVFGHLAEWNTCHVGFAGQCVTPPHSASGYAYFMVHSVRARDESGQAITLPVGYGTIGTGHADIRAGAMAAAEHYDNTGTAAFEIAVGEDEHGIWFAGRLMPGLDEVAEHRARGTVFSGDWRTVRGQLEMLAALGVNTPGFPVPRARVASGQPLSIVAAGVIHAPAPEAPAPEAPAPEAPADGPFTGTQALGVSEEEFRTVIAWINAQRLTGEQQAAITELGELLGDGPTATELAEAELAYLLEADHPWLAEDVELCDDEDATEHDADHLGDKLTITAAGRKVLHLPSYIKRIANHLKKKGMSQSHAIASAVNAAKKMCATGDLNFPGDQDVNPGSRAQACAAVAQWTKDRPGAR